MPTPESRRGDADVVALAVVTGIGNSAVGLSHLDGVLEGLLTPQRLDRRINAFSIRRSRATSRNRSS